jgi:HK97 family phage major capsid protein
LKALPATNGHWILNRKSLLSIASLRGTNGQLVSKVHRDPDTGLFILLGAPCLICPSMDDIGTSGKVPVIFGDPKFFVTRAVRNSLRVQVSSQFAALSGQMFYQAFWRAQGGVATPDLSPLPPSPFVALVQGT